MLLSRCLFYRSEKFSGAVHGTQRHRRVLPRQAPGHLPAGVVQPAVGDQDPLQFPPADGGPQQARHRPFQGGRVPPRRHQGHHRLPPFHRDRNSASAAVQTVHAMPTAAKNASRLSCSNSTQIRLLSAPLYERKGLSAPGLFLQHPFQILTRVGGGALRHLFRRPGGHNRTAAAAAFGAQVDEVVGRFDHIRLCSMTTMVFPASTSFLQHVDQAAHIVGVQSRGGLVQDIGPFCRWSAWKAPWPASRAGPRRRKGWWRAGPGADSPGPPPAASGSCAGCGEGWQRSPPPRPRSCPALRRYFCPCTAPPGSRGCSAGPCTPRRAHKYPAGSASRS